MSVLLKDLVFDAVKLPVNWWEQIGFIAAEKLNIAPGALQNTEIISCAVDSRRGSPKLLVTLKSDCSISGIGAELTAQEWQEYSVLPPEIPEKSSLKNPIVVGTGPAGIFAGLILALAGCKPLIIDCGSEDFFFKVNCEFHDKLMEAKIPHDFYVRPGVHNWDYWRNSIQHQMLFFSNYFKSAKE